MLTGFWNTVLKGYILRPATRAFSTGGTIQERFQQAWEESQQDQVVVTPEPQDKARYGHGYYQANASRLKKGYEHPYHSKHHPLLFTSPGKFWSLISRAAGPEQVSPHYETLSRSRRAVIFLFFYIGTISSVAGLGGLEQNEWLKNLVFHHKFLITFFIGYIEIKHFHWMPGPKFSIFYDAFTRYEHAQLVN